MEAEEMEVEGKGAEEMEAEKMEQGKGGREGGLVREEEVEQQGKGEREGDLVKEARGRAGIKCLLKMNLSVD